MIPFAPIYQHLPFYGKTLSPFFLWKLWILKPAHFIKGWGGGGRGPTMQRICKSTTCKFDWALDNIRIEKIILATI